MMNVFGKYFEYDGISSDDFDAVLCSIDEVDTVRDTGINYELNTGEISPLRPKANFYNKRYTESLKFKITIAKVCKHTDEYFSVDEQRKIVRWLTSSADYRKFKIIDYDDSYYHLGIDYFCLCTGYSETVINDLVVAMTFVFQCNAPYGFYQEEIIKFDITDSKTLRIDNYSDERELLYYPYLQLTGTDTGTIIIHNNRNPDNDMELHVINGQTLYVDNEYCDITDDKNSFSYSSDTNLKWLSLLPGVNEITITGAVKGYIKCQYPRKAGI